MGQVQKSFLRLWKEEEEKEERRRKHSNCELQSTPCINPGIEGMCGFMEGGLGWRERQETIKDRKPKK